MGRPRRDAAGQREARRQPGTSGPAGYNSIVYNTTRVLYTGPSVTCQEFKRWLAKQGCTFESGHGGHVTVRRGSRKSTLPMHGKNKELGTGLVNAIKKALGLK